MLYPADAPAAEMPAIGGNDRTKKRNPLLHRNNLHLPVIQIEAQPATQEIRDKRDSRGKPVSRIIYDVKVIHVSPVMAEAEISLDVLIQFVEIDVAEQLRREVAYGQSAAGSGFEKAL